MPPYFALGWFITWFSHNVQQLDQISRLFDLFMASHPLMPLYVVAQVMMVSIRTVVDRGRRWQDALHKLSRDAEPTHKHRT